MKHVKIELPIEEAIELLRVARAESRCLVEHGDLITDADIQKRTQLILSARERIVTAIEDLEDSHVPLNVPQGALDLTQPGRSPNPMIDQALAAATTLPCDGGRTMSLQNNVLGGQDAPVAMRHGVPLHHDNYGWEKWDEDDSTMESHLAMKYAGLL